MMPPNSCAVPGKKPGTSSNVTSGRLKQSQNRTKRAAFSDALMSRHPARWAGWFATIPTGRPPRSEEHTSELQSQSNLVCRLLLEKKKKRRKEAKALQHNPHCSKLVHHHRTLHTRLL